MSSNTFLPKPSLLGAVLWMLGAVVSLTLMALAGRELMAEILIFEIIFFRNALCLMSAIKRHTRHATFSALDRYLRPDERAFASA